jgi:hypothetical protein
MENYGHLTIKVLPVDANGNPTNPATQTTLQNIEAYDHLTADHTLDIKGSIPGVVINTVPANHLLSTYSPKVGDPIIFQGNPLTISVVVFNFDSNSWIITAV